MRLLKLPHAYLVASTTDVSLRGIGFVHGKPLPTQHSILTFDLDDEQPVSLVTQIQWTKRLTDRSYHSGGKFITVTETPEFFHETHPTTSRFDLPRRRL